MTFSKFIAANIELQSSVFDESAGALFGVNGRLSGFYPTPAAGGDPSTPGIISTTLIGGSIARAVSVILSIGNPGDDLRYPASGQKTSSAIINGSVVESDAPVPINITIIEASGSTLTDRSPIVIFVSYDISGAPVFGVKRESLIDASPQMIAKLAFYSPDSQVWLPYPAVSLQGISQRLNDAASKLGAFQVTKNTLTQVRVAPGSIVSQFGRTTNPTITLLNTPAAPANFRKDVLFANDPGSESLPATFTFLSNAEVTTPALALTDPPSRPTAPSAIPLAEIIQNSTGISSIIDVRPVQSWQTDTLLATNPTATSRIGITALQPGAVFRDTTAGAVPWELLVMRGKDPILGSVNKSKLVVGLTGPEVKRTFAAPASGSLSFTPGINQFPAVPYVIQSSFSVVSATTGFDVTSDPNYAVKFDFLNGVFTTTAAGITAQSFNEVFQVTFHQLNVLFSFGDDLAVSVKENALIVDHIAANAPYWLLPPTDPLNLPYTFISPGVPRAQKLGAHTGSNIVYNNNVGLPGIPATSVLSLQKTIEVLLTNPIPPQPDPLIGRRFIVPWRSRNFIPSIVSQQNTKFGTVTIFDSRIIGPAGSVALFGDQADSLIPPIPKATDEFRFPLKSGKIIGASISLVALDNGTPATNYVDNDLIFSICVDDNTVQLPEPDFAPGRSGGGPQGGTQIRVFGKSILPVPMPILFGQTLRLWMTGPGFSYTAPSGVNSCKFKILTISMDVLIEVT